MLHKTNLYHLEVPISSLNNEIIVIYMVRVREKNLTALSGSLNIIIMNHDVKLIILFLVIKYFCCCLEIGLHTPLLVM